MRASLIWKVAGVVVVLAAGVWGTRTVIGYSALLATARSEAKVAREEAVFALGVAANEAARADAEHSAAVVERRAAHQLAAEANRLGAENRRFADAFKLATAQSPDTCSAIVQAAEELVESERAVRYSLEAAYVASVAAYDSLDVAFLSLKSAYDRIVPATKNLASATERLEKATRRSFFARLAPKVQFGAFAGVDVRGRPNAVAGVGLGWTL